MFLSCDSKTLRVMQRHARRIGASRVGLTVRTHTEGTRTLQTVEWSCDLQLVRKFTVLVEDHATHLTVGAAGVQESDALSNGVQGREVFAGSYAVDEFANVVRDVSKKRDRAVCLELGSQRLTHYS